jgi:hypothetical protein
VSDRVGVMPVFSENKSGIVIATISCIVSMFIFRDTVISVVVALAVTSPFFVYMLRNENNNFFHFMKNNLSRVANYFAMNLIMMVFSILIIYIFSDVIKNSNIISIMSVAGYSVLYCIAAPFLYRIATSRRGGKYQAQHYLLTISIVSASEIVILLLNKAASLYPITSLVAAPLVCLIFVLSFYLITIVNLIINNLK